MLPSWSFGVCPEPSASGLVIGGDVCAQGGPACRQQALGWGLSAVSELGAASPSAGEKT